MDCINEDLHSASIPSLDDVGICISWCDQREDCYGFVIEGYGTHAVCYYKKFSCQSAIHSGPASLVLFVKVQV